MAIKKSELYSTLWESCDKLRGSMDASQNKNYVLAMRFIKYISDTALPSLSGRVDTLNGKVSDHLKEMGLVW